MPPNPRPMLLGCLRRRNAQVSLSSLDGTQREKLPPRGRGFMGTDIGGGLPPRAALRKPINRHSRHKKPAAGGEAWLEGCCTPLLNFRRECLLIERDASRLYTATQWPSLKQDAEPASALPSSNCACHLWMGVETSTIISYVLQVICIRSGETRRGLSNKWWFWESAGR